MTDPGSERAPSRSPGLQRLRAATPRFHAPHFRTLGPGSVSSLLKIALDVAYFLLWLLAVIMTIAFVAAIFVPLDNVTVTSGDRELPLIRPLVLFGLGAVIAYFGAFILILRSLRLMFRTLTQGDPFHPRNVVRLRQIGLVLAVVTIGVFVAQSLMSRQALGYMEAPEIGDLMTPVFSVLIVFVLAEVFKEGARLRRESELTI